MSAILKPFLTPQQYLAQERKAEFRSEYYKGEVFAMAGATLNHTLIKDNLAGETRNELKGRNCHVLTSDMRLLVSPTGLYTYPDIAIVCDQPQFEDDVLDTLLNPRIVIEVLSESTEKYDRGTKFEQYCEIKTLQEYILVSQVAPSIERFVRQPDGSWLLTAFRGLQNTFEYASIPVKIALAEIYSQVEFPEKPYR